MTDTMIPAGMTEKEYYEIHASQEEFLDWYYKQELPQYENQALRWIWWPTALSKEKSSSY